MFKNYIKIAFRNILRHKGYSFINITGLAIGLTCCILILMWVVNELSFDRFHEKYENIYRLCTDLTLGGNNRRAANSSPPMGPAIVEEFPEAVAFVRLNPTERLSVKYQDREFYEEGIFYADHSIFDIFTFPLLVGDRQTVLKTAYSAVITEETAQKYFGEENPIGKILKIDNNQNITVTGVTKNVPANSHLQFNMLFSFETLASENPEQMQQWGRMGNTTYLLLDNQHDYKKFESKLQSIVDKNLGPVLARVGGSLHLFIQPLKTIHLYSNLEGEYRGGGDISQVYLFSGIAFFVLFIACINFINLATARSASRAHEVGLRKTLGALKSKLIVQFLGESFLYSLCAMIISVLFLILVLPVFKNLANREIQVTLSQMTWLIPGMIGLVILVGLTAGSYPAFFLSSFQPVNVLKGSLKEGASNSRFRSILVIIQFAISIALVIGTMTIYNQLQYMKNKPLGFQKNHVLVISNTGGQSQISPLTLREELLNLTDVEEVGMSSTVPGGRMRMMNFLPEGFAENESQLMFTMDIDAFYIPTLGMEIIQGRNFSMNFITDKTEAVLINETTAAKFGWDNPIGKTIRSTIPTPSGPQNITKTVIGMVKDFHHLSLHRAIEPMIINVLPSPPGMISVRIAPDDVTKTINQIRETWERLHPNQQFEYTFLDKSFDAQYRDEEKLGQLFIYFALLAIVIASLGLFGLAAFMTERRTREIGIRKVLGASVAHIIGLLSREFVILVTIANLIAWPAGYFIMRHWLTNFAYRTRLNGIIFLLAGILALVIALITVSYQSYKAARTNPADTIKYE